MRFCFSLPSLSHLLRVGCCYARVQIESVCFGLSLSYFCEDVAFHENQWKKKIFYDGFNFCCISFLLNRLLVLEG